ncbi:MAG: hypothetical protein ACKOSS_09745 [Planctomycetia bacterium]
MKHFNALILAIVVAVTSGGAFRAAQAAPSERGVSLAGNGVLVVTGWAGRPAAIVDFTTGATTRVWIASDVQCVALPWPVIGSLGVLIDQTAYVVNDRDAMWD